MVNDTYRAVMIIFLVACGTCSYSCSIKEPVLSPQTVQVDVLTGHIVDIKSYKLPKGNFRGVLWPSLSRQYFEIWIVSGNKFMGYRELFYYVKAPHAFIEKTTDVTDNWIIDESILPGNRMSYLAKRKDGNMALRLTMPLRKQHYSFSVLKNDHGDEIVLFMDISEYMVDNGIFGWVEIK